MRSLAGLILALGALQADGAPVAPELGPELGPELALEIRLPREASDPAAPQIAGWIAAAKRSGARSLRIAAEGRSGAAEAIGAACRSAGLRFGPRAEAAGRGAPRVATLVAPPASGPRPLGELLVEHYLSIGRGADLVLAATTDSRGELTEECARRLGELGEEIERRFAHPLGTASGSGETLELRLDPPAVVDQIVLEETSPGPGRVRSYLVELLATGGWREAARGKGIGPRRVRLLSPAPASALRLRVTEAAGVPALRLSVHRAFSEDPRDAARALIDLDLLCALEERPEDFHRRAYALFKLGRFPEALRDFDASIRGGRPHDEDSCWERGLVYYYLGEFEKGARQFEGYHRVGPLDIENGLWRFLCIAEREGIEKGRASLLEYPRRERPPFPALLDLYAGKGSPEAVLAAAPEGDEGKFYAHYYLGKHFELLRDRARAREHFLKALARPIDHFMFDCCHLDLGRIERGLLGNPHSKADK